MCLILTLSLLGVQTSAHSLGGTMLKPEDLTNTKISQRGDMGFWHQQSVKRKDVKTITFLSSTSTAPRNVLDFSANGDLIVMGWIENGNVYVATDGQIALNEDSSYLFSGMRNLTKINFNGVVDTECCCSFKRATSFVISACWICSAPCSARCAEADCRSRIPTALIRIS